MGVFLFFSCCCPQFYGLPHARGGVSQKQRCVVCIGWSSPRTWGCFLDICRFASVQMVFPTHVGVFLFAPSPTSGFFSLPHARGGVSCAEQALICFVWSSPRTWGCFYESQHNQPSHRVFPTHVGVFLISDHAASIPVRLPHARGGVSNGTGVILEINRSSPRTWGCFLEDRFYKERSEVFPTHVGVFLMA